MLTLTAEALLQVCFGDETRVVDVEVVESEEQVLLRDGLSTVNGHSQELSVVDLTIVVEVNALEDIVDLLFGHVKLAEGSPDLAKLQGSGIVLVQSSEGVPQFGEVKGRGVDLIHKEGKSLNLEALRLAELGDTLEHSNLVGVEKGGVVACMVRVNVIASEPGVLEALLGANSGSRVLVQHLAHQVFCGVRDSVPVCWVERQGLFQHIAEDLHKCSYDPQGISKLKKLQDFLVVIAFEGRVAAKENKEDDTETPHIAALVIVALEDLRCDIVRSAHHSVHLLDLLLLREALRQTKVNQLDFRVVCRVVH